MTSFDLSTFTMSDAQRKRYDAGKWTRLAEHEPYAEIALFRGAECACLFEAELNTDVVHCPCGDKAVLVNVVDGIAETYAAMLAWVNEATAFARTLSRSDRKRFLELLSV